jgi:hypothetical protein
MKLNRWKNQVLLIIVSLLILFYTFFLIRFDNWVYDLYYYLTLFSIIFAIDFVLYVGNSSFNHYSNHYLFCTFPITRYKLLFLEIRDYLSRIELFIFLINIQLFISYFFLLNNRLSIILLIILLVYIIQVVFLITVFFIIKNLIHASSFSSDLRNYLSIYISLNVMISVVSDKYIYLKNILVINPLSNGLLSFLEGGFPGILGILGTVILGFILFILLRIRFMSWIEN